MSAIPHEIERLHGYATALGFKGSTTMHQLNLECSDVATMLVERTDSNTLQTAIRVRTSSYHWSGERSDLNEICAIVIALSLGRGGTSCRLLHVAHPSVDLPSEVYATYLLPAQPNATGYSCDDRGIQQVEELMASILVALANLQRLLQHCGWDGSDAPATKSVSIAERNWLNSAVGAIGSTIDESTFNSRRNPDWLFLRSNAGYSVYRSEALYEGLKICCGEDDAPSIDGPTGTIFRHKHVMHYVNDLDVVAFEELLKQLGKQIKHLVVRAIDNRIIMSSNGVTLIRELDSGSRQVSAERERLLVRHSAENDFLFGASPVSWLLPLSDDRFEELIRAILLSEPGVRRVWKFGHSNEPDGGCDLLAEWELPPKSSEIRPDSFEPTHRVHRVVIQCKSGSAPVGVRDVTSVGDVLDHHDASGFLLVSRSRITAPLVQRLDRRRLTHNQWIDWWVRSDLEDRIRRNPHLLRQFGDVVSIGT